MKSLKNHSKFVLMIATMNIQFDNLVETPMVNFTCKMNSIGITYTAKMLEMCDVYGMCWTWNKAVLFKMYVAS